MNLSLKIVYVKIKVILQKLETLDNSSVNYNKNRSIS